MTMTTTQAIITIAAVVLGTMATRFIPFMIFPEGKNPPEFVQYLGTVLPYAAIGLLIIYCLKDVPSSSTHGLPEAIAIIFIVLLHKWKKKYSAEYRRRNHPVYDTGTDCFPLERRGMSIIPHFDIPFLVILILQFR